MSRVSGYLSLGCAALLLAGSTTAVAVAVARDEAPAAAPSAPRPARPATPAVSASRGYGEVEAGHSQRRRGRGHGSGGHDADTRQADSRGRH